MPRQSNNRPEIMGVVRKRKAHTKSRGGCNNCKLRHVKCDEAKPNCKTCVSFRVTCTYDKLSSTLQAVSEGMFLVNFLSVSLNSQVLTMLHDNVPPSSVSKRFPFKDQDLEILNRFHERTILSIRTDQTVNLYQRESVRLAIQNPFLFHLVLTVTLMHDRLTLPHYQSPSTPTPAELYHHAAGSSHFNALLSLPPCTLTATQKDAIFIGAIILSCTSFAQVESHLPSTKLWPFVSGDNDLNWLRLCTGKKEIHKLADVTRPDSSLREVAQEFHLSGGPPVAGIDAEADRKALSELPKRLVTLLGLDPYYCQTPETNVYYTPAVFIGRMMPVNLVGNANSANLLVCLILVSHFPQRFMQMLEEKDPRSLLLLAHYYGKIAQSGRWWMWMRATVEGRAIVEYLEVYHRGDIGGLEELLEFPRRWCCVEGKFDGPDGMV
ncbi:hypothetical protein QBC42DRAFT_195176 [Cladorrhinum samala]|uniref:Zn(2)-C6 fungal-type domain-containing protein n=1 Tax=Cladorrhinum samala TaxID=585594 RepID=A0AAV9I1Z0_9PEZI|nr:hypothetical protein QBC42DRAFT_195176 [Cladorrhinum samala]